MNCLNPDKYYPKCYDISDASEFQDFIEEFKYYECFKILTHFLEHMPETNLSVQQLNFYK